MANTLFSLKRVSNNQPLANTLEIDWLFALPIALCGLKLDDEAVRVAVGLRLGLDLCIPHQCHCGSPVDAHGLHSFVWQRPENNFTHTKAALKVVFFRWRLRYRWPVAYVLYRATLSPLPHRVVDFSRTLNWWHPMPSVRVIGLLAGSWSRPVTVKDARVLQFAIRLN